MGNSLSLLITTMAVLIIAIGTMLAVLYAYLVLLYHCI